jgi:hypothetical protein
MRIAFVLPKAPPMVLGAKRCPPATSARGDQRSLPHVSDTLDRGSVVARWFPLATASARQDCRRGERASAGAKGSGDRRMHTARAAPDLHQPPPGGTRTAKGPQMPPLRLGVSDGTRTRDRLDRKKPGTRFGPLVQFSALHRSICGLRAGRAARRGVRRSRSIPAIPVGFAPDPKPWAPNRRSSALGSTPDLAARVIPSPSRPDPGSDQHSRFPVSASPRRRPCRIVVCLGGDGTLARQPELRFRPKRPQPSRHGDREAGS